MNRDDVRVCVLTLEGTNCEDETLHAFASLGAKSERVHLNQLVRDPPGRHRSLADYQVLVLPGGFSSGDYVRAGAIWASRMRSGLRDDLRAFAEEGKPVVGICNGFQALVELGFLPAMDGDTEIPQAALATNDSGHYECRPSILRYENRGRCGPLALLPRDGILQAPSAHTEGKFTFPQGKEEAMWEALREADQLLFRYVDPNGGYADYPWNPNGSLYNIAGVCSPAGNVLGLMPHPERSFSRYLHPDWTRSGAEADGDGRLFFDSILTYVTESF
ncbi:MAG: phosphoribosylformylglycinamidine synthase subunit PurQ [Thermoplasmata archaeon]